MPRNRNRKDQMLAVGRYPIDWLEERSGLIGGLRYFLFRKVPGDSSWWHTLGSATLTAFLVQLGTGVILAMYYKPDPNSAYESVQHINNDVTLGWLVRGMHRWGASVFIILIFFHMARVFLFGAYKYPRELNWVGININGTAPFLGPYLASFLRGGSEIGADTLARFYSIHMLLLPGAILGLIGLHLYLVVRLGVSSPPWSSEAAGRERAEPPPVPGAGLVNPAPRGVTKRPD
jgi:quinol-cytochrome oxidoreductase complex cytochrome b subunit